jgi:hypothetical protein
LTITNLGDFTAKDVVVKDTLPVEVGFVSAFGLGWAITQAGGIVTATRSTLAVNVPTTIIISITVPAVANSLFNEATVTSSTPDPNLSNNKSSTTTPVITEQPPPPPLVTKLGNPAITSKKYATRSARLTQADKQMLTFIDGAYRTLLGRAPNELELRQQLTKLQSGMSRQQIIAPLWNSNEHFALQAKQIYNTYLHRAPNPLELSMAIQQFRAGADEAALVQQLVTSAEYQAQNSSPAKLVGRLHLDLTGKLPDLATNQNMVLSLANQSLLQAAQGLMASQAALQFSVDSVYRLVLHRPATAAEMQFSALQLQGGALTLAGLSSQLLASNEFYQLAWKSKK